MAIGTTTAPCVAGSSDDDSKAWRKRAKAEEKFEKRAFKADEKFAKRIAKEDRKYAQAYERAYRYPRGPLLAGIGSAQHRAAHAFITASAR